MVKHERVRKVFGTVAERLYRHVFIDERGCFVWLGAKNQKGYGVMGIEKRRTRVVHRVSYALWYGSIPKGHEVHHECRNTSCVNPGHLRAVLPMEHPDTFGAVNSAKTHCPKGHAYDVIIRIKGRRVRGCRTCRLETNRAYWAQRGGRPAQRAYLQAWREKQRALGLYP